MRACIVSGSKSKCSEDETNISFKSQCDSRSVAWASLWELIERGTFVSRVSLPKWLSNGLPGCCFTGKFVCPRAALCLAAAEERRLSWETNASSPSAIGNLIFLRKQSKGVPHGMVSFVCFLKQSHFSRKVH